jgi:hypothetical protein
MNEAAMTTIERDVHHIRGFDGCPQGVHRLMTCGNITLWSSDFYYEAITPMRAAAHTKPDFIAEGL